MIVREWIEDKFSLLGFPYSESVELALSDGLDPQEDVNDDVIEKLEVNLFKYLPYMMSAPQSISESGFSLSRQKLDGLYRMLLLKHKDKYNLTDMLGVLSSIEDVTDVW